MDNRTCENFHEDLDDFWVNSQKGNEAPYVRDVGWPPQVELMVFMCSDKKGYSLDSIGYGIDSSLDQNIQRWP